MKTSAENLQYNDLRNKDSSIVQHHLNPLHVRASLIKEWVSMETIKTLIPEYEKAVKHILYPETKH